MFSSGSKDFRTQVITHIAHLHNGRNMVIGDSRGNLLFYAVEAESAEIILLNRRVPPKSIVGDFGALYALCAYQNGCVSVHGGENELHIFFWDEEGQLLEAQELPGVLTNRLLTTVRGNETLLLVNENENTLHLFRRATPPRHYRLDFPLCAILALQDLRVIYACNNSLGLLRIFEVDDGIDPPPAVDPTKADQIIALAECEQTLASVSSKGTLRIWDKNSLVCLHTYPAVGQPGPKAALFALPDDRLAYLNCNAQRLLILNAATGACLQQIEVETPFRHILSVHRNGHMLFIRGDFLLRRSNLVIESSFMHLDWRPNVSVHGSFPAAFRAGAVMLLALYKGGNEEQPIATQWPRLPKELLFMLLEFFATTVPRGPEPDWNLPGGAVGMDDREVELEGEDAWSDSSSYTEYTDDDDLLDAGGAVLAGRLSSESPRAQEEGATPEELAMARFGLFGSAPEDELPTPPPCGEFRP